MNLLELACEVFDRAESLGVPHMVVEAIAAGAYGIARATRDVDLLVSVDPNLGVFHLMNGLDDLVEFEPQARFDTITWGRRWVGLSKSIPPFTIELFELLDDPFCASEFARHGHKFVAPLNRKIWRSRQPKMLSFRKSAGAAARISTTPAMCSPCKGPSRWTWLKSKTGAPPTTPQTDWKPS